MAGSIESGIQFIRYKMDKLNFEMNTTLGNLHLADYSNCPAKFRFAFANPIRYKNNDEYFYVTGLIAQMQLVEPGDENRKIATGEFRISGIFKSVGTLDKETEEKLIKIQAPVILFPFLRANVSSVLLNAGFSQIQMPLINVAAMVESSPVKIEYVD